MLDAVEAYFARKDLIEDDYTARYNAAEAAYREYSNSENYSVRQTAHKTFQETKNVLVELRSAELHTAWVALKLSGDKLVTYIAERHEGTRRTEAEEVLQALPMTTAQLRTFGAEHRWCEWQAHVRRAIKAGAVEDDLSPARRVLDDWLNANIGQTSIPAVMRMVDAIADNEAFDRAARMEAEAEATLDAVAEADQGSPADEEEPAF